MTDPLIKLNDYTRVADLVDKLPDGEVRCTACAHHCLIRPGRRGICQVRYNEGGELRAPWGYTAGIGVDPIEKKPFSHFLPGSIAYTFGMLGCNFHCRFCQNWVTSQVGKDDNCYDLSIHPISAKTIVQQAKQYGAEVIASSYNEPIITAEWAHAVFTEAKEQDLKCVMVSNGYASRDALFYLRPVMDGYKIDLKSMQELNYRSMGGVLSHVLESIRVAIDLGYWVEIVTLVIPDYNDEVDELWSTAREIASISRDIPWHITGFHPDYKMLDHNSTSANQLIQAAEIAQEAGLRYVYAGNLPGRVGSLENTYCPTCSTLLVERRGYMVIRNDLSGSGVCPQCHSKIAGVW